MADTTCLIVTYNSASVITACLDRIPADAPVIIVDNASTDDTLRRVELSGRGATVIEAGRNIGYGRAANLGLEAVATRNCLLLNPDAWLEPSAVSGLEQAGQDFPDRPILAPRLVDERGRVVSQYGEQGVAAQPGGADLETVTGCALFFQMDPLSRIGFFDEAFFLYFEETDLCHRAVAAGQPVRYVPGAEVVHLSGKSSGGGQRGKLLAHFEWSKAYFTQKHSGDAAETEIERRHRELNRKALLYSVLSPGKKGPEYRWRRYGTEAYLKGLNAEELHLELSKM